MEKGDKAERGEVAVSAKMASIGNKRAVAREAVAEGELLLKKGTVSAIRKGTVKKGDVITVAQTAGIQAAKNTWNIIPLCHQIPLHEVAIVFGIKNDRLGCVCTVRADYKTGVEMEALVGVTVALLTVWDMVKYLEKDKKGQYPETMMANIRVIRKMKGAK
jgi:cyclic pyranopterin phosphate synthase